MLSQDLQFVVQQEVDSAAAASGARSAEAVVMTRTGQVLAIDAVRPLAQNLATVLECVTD